MRRRHVVVLYQNCLFGEAIAKILSENEHIEVTTLPVQTVTPESLRAIHPDAIVLEEEPAPDDVRAALLDVAPALTVVVGPEANTAEVYEKHEVIQATAAGIIARIMASARPAAVSHRGDSARGAAPLSAADEP